MPPVHATQAHRDDTNFRYTDEPYVEKLPVRARVALMLAAVTLGGGIVIGFGYALLWALS